MICREKEDVVSFHRVYYVLETFNKYQYVCTTQDIWILLRVSGRVHQLPPTFSKLFNSPSQSCKIMAILGNFGGQFTTGSNMTLILW